MKITDITIKSGEISTENYENVFNIYTDENDFYYFNLLKKVDFPDDIDPNIYDYYEALPDDFYPLISYKFYNNIKLWWIVCAVNHIDDPTSAPIAGTLLKIIKPYYIQVILSKVNN